MYVLKLRNLLIAFFILIILLVVVSFNTTNKIETMSKPYTNCIVVDAGHGLPDGGATANDIVESDLNLEIAIKLEDRLNSLGYDVIMTREDENNIADEDKQKSISEMKRSDLTNRVKIINDSEADFCVSIHLNKYSSEKYWGWQTFYNSASEEGKRLAVNIQKGIGNFIDKNNNRQALTISNIKIVDKTNIPVVIVECGFISNLEEATLLKDSEYQEKLVSRNLRGNSRIL